MKSFKEFLTESSKRKGMEEAKSIVKRVFGSNANKIEIYPDITMDEFAVRAEDPEEYNPPEAEMRKLADQLRRGLSGNPTVTVMGGIRFNNQINSTTILVEY